MNRLACLAAFAAALLSPIAVSAAAPPAPGAAEDPQARFDRIAERLHPVSGDVRIPGADAVLHLGEEYYFLPAEEARLVLTEAWGNPPETARGVLGMVFPAGRSFADDTWGAVITYERTGYVSDSDASSTDYAALLATLRGDEQAINAERTRLGYPATHLVGWAQQPTYDPRGHSLIWALNVQFAGSPENTLNYDIRLLGRRGVLSLNMITGMSKLEETRAAAARLAAAAEFVPGARYADYREGDHTAEYGIAGLIAAGVGATAAKKAGVIAAVLAFGKKFIVLILAGLALLGGWLRRLFRGREEEEVYYDEAAPAEYAAEGPPLDAADPTDPADAQPER